MVAIGGALTHNENGNQNKRELQKSRLERRITEGTKRKENRETKLEKCVRPTKTSEQAFSLQVAGFRKCRNNCNSRVEQISEIHSALLSREVSKRHTKKSKMEMVETHWIQRGVNFLRTKKRFECLTKDILGLERPIGCRYTAFQTKNQKSNRLCRVGRIAKNT